MCDIVFSVPDVFLSHISVALNMHWDLHSTFPSWGVSPSLQQAFLGQKNG